MSVRFWRLWCGAMLLATVVIASDEVRKAESQPIIAALKPFNSLVGSWRGIGQPRRGSNAGSWQETSEVVWSLKGKDAGLVWTIKESPQWKSALLTYQPASEEFVLHVEEADSTKRVLKGKADKQQLVLETSREEPGEGLRVTLNLLNENRVIWLLERRTSEQAPYSRVAEIGVQRQGTRLAAAASSEKECIVTGGLGTMTVSFKGQTYYVCCGGCREAFHADPEGTLAAWKERVAKEKK